MVARAGVLTDDKPFRISVEICDGVSRHRPTEALSRDAKMIFIEAEQSSCAYRGRRPRCPAHGDHVIRSMTTGAAHELDGAVGFIF
jgi:hypothetical protein